MGLLALIVPVLLTSGCAYLNKVIAKDSLNQGVILYNQGRIKAAQEMFQSATDRDPSSPIAWLYYGATVVKDYKELGEPKKSEVANQALDIYKKALDLSNGNCKIYDNAVSYIATIYDDLSNEDEWRNWLLKRADGPCSDKDTKAVTYYSVAVRYWTCAHDQTTRYQDKAVAMKDPFHYRNMDYDAAKDDKAKAEACAAKGLEYIEKALKEDPEYVDAYYYKGLLYREQQMLTKEEAKRKELDSIAQKISDQANTLQKKKEAAAAAAAAQQAAPQG
jgi:tetratricopeptide (TPR) repeat protein